MLAISPQDVDSHERWIEQEGFPFPLLADTEKVAAEAYGVVAPMVGIRRSIFVVDSTGALGWSYSGTVRAIFKKPAQLAKIVQGLD